MNKKDYLDIALPFSELKESKDSTMAVSSTRMIGRTKQEEENGG